MMISRVLEEKEVSSVMIDLMLFGDVILVDEV